MSEGEVKAALLIIGNEILSGRTQDANLQYIALGLNEVGVRLAEVRVIPDDEAEIINTLNEVRRRFTYVFTTGGIGPTHDDITTACVAKAFGVKVVRSQRTVERLIQQSGTREHSESRLRMADVPEGAELIENAVSWAPGFHIGNVYVMAGIPRVMQSMFETVKGTLKGGSKMLSKSVTVLLGESAIAVGLEGIQKKYPQLEIGSYPFSREGLFGTAIVTRGTDAAAIMAASNEVHDLVHGLGGKTEDDGLPPQ